MEKETPIIGRVKSNQLINQAVESALKKQKEGIKKILVDKAQDITVEPGSIKEESLYAINLNEVLKAIDEYEQTK